MRSSVPCLFCARYIVPPSPLADALARAAGSKKCMAVVIWDRAVPSPHSAGTNDHGEAIHVHLLRSPGAGVNRLLLLGASSCAAPTESQTEPRLPSSVFPAGGEATSHAIAHDASRVHSPATAGDRPDALARSLSASADFGLVAAAPGTGCQMVFAEGSLSRRLPGVKVRCRACLIGTFRSHASVVCPAWSEYPCPVLEVHRTLFDE